MLYCFSYMHWCLKFPLFLHPFPPVLHAEDNYLYRFVLTALNSLFGHAALPYAILSFIILIFPGHPAEQHL